MGRQIKRVALDFDHPVGKAWPGYLAPWDDAKSDEENERIQDAWYADGRREPPAGDGWQVWETVTEGSPVTKVFKTAEELAQHLSTVGDLWHENAVREGRAWRTLPTYEQALTFVKNGWAPSFVMTIPADPSEPADMRDSYGARPK